MNGIEAFLELCKEALSLVDLRGDVFLLHLKEREFWYHSKGESLLSLLPNLVKWQRRC
jgi:hypothetical protein